MSLEENRETTFPRLNHSKIIYQECATAVSFLLCSLARKVTTRLTRNTLQCNHATCGANHLGQAGDREGQFGLKISARKTQLSELYCRRNCRGMIEEAERGERDHENLRYFKRRLPAFLLSLGPPTACYDLELFKPHGA